MEVMEVMQMTEFGAIPFSWEVLSIGDLVLRGLIEKPLDGNHGNIHPKSSDFVEAGIPFIMANNVVDGHIDLVNCHFIRKEQADHLQKGFSITGDVLITHKGTVGNVGIVGFLNCDYIMLTPQVTYYRVKEPQSISNKYIKQFFQSEKFQKILKNLSGGGTRAYVGITNQRNLPFLLPPINEQTAIATALSDTDALITSLEKLIAKKRDIKQGAMQELLKPKDGWKEDFLVNYVDYIHGKAHERDINETGKYIVVNSKFISSDGLIKKFSNRNYCSAKKGDILTVLSDLPNGKALAKCFLVDKNDTYAVNQRVCIWRSKGSNPEFLHYILNRNKYFLNLDDGVSQTHILNHHILKCRISVPLDYSEQIRIATILSNMDFEIKILEAKLEKYKLIKQGMMQTLLTGQIRLV